MDMWSEDASRVSFRVDVFQDFCGLFLKLLVNMLMTDSIRWQKYVLLFIWIMIPVPLCHRQSFDPV